MVYSAMLQWSDLRLTIAVDPVLRQAIDTMPAGDWLRVRIVGKRGKDLK